MYLMYIVTRVLTHVLSGITYTGSFDKPLLCPLSRAILMSVIQANQRSDAALVDCWFCTEYD